MSARLRLLPALTRAQLRLLPGRQLAVAAAAGIGFAVAGAVIPERPDLSGLLITARLAAVCGAAGVAFVLDDPAERTTTAVVPVPLRLRRGLRVLPAIPLAAAWWAALLLVVRDRLDPALWAGLPVRDLSLEAAGLLAVTVALAAAGLTATAERSGSVFAIPALLLGLLMAQTILPARLVLFAEPGSGAWTASHQRWAMLLGIAVAGFLLAGHDPAHRRLGALLTLGRAGSTARPAARPGSGHPGGPPRPSAPRPSPRPGR